MGTELYVLRACLNDDAADLIAVGMDHSVVVLRQTSLGFETVASFHVGSRVTAIAWSPASVSSSKAEDWSIELIAGTSDYGLHILTKPATKDARVFDFGGGLSGHHGKINDITYCGGETADSTKYVATVSDDKTLMVWDLNPSIHIPPKATTAAALFSTPSLERHPPVSYAVLFPLPLTTVCAHPSTSKEFLVSDCHGTVYITDWRSDRAAVPDIVDESLSWHQGNLLELVDPSTMLSASAGNSLVRQGNAAWRRDNPDLIGAVNGSRWAVWNVAKLQGCKPFLSGTTLSPQSNRFRWCHTFPEYFAISSSAPEGATICVYQLNYVQAQPDALDVTCPAQPFMLSRKPHFVADFDWMATKGIPRIAVAVGRQIKIFRIGDA
ncbi:hypothetical protein FISHEDRAFT_64060 [Fistulina hepatica ATCC 64428]|uniref:Uncharacterized protein n=1 Tax=Fistulina hepatica ATCC 64428 TaxID=1128425 RepID=A0A0D7AMD4_9AGAR|nr:hypothetical protein FISHEDRAFT_64060 [Fistulina hepatica ATCC 64428]